MLGITFEGGAHRMWYIGDPSPIKPHEAIAIQQITIDDDELEYVKKMFGQPADYWYTNPRKPIDINIPLRNTVTLFGDFARTIIANLIE